ncbi:MAG: hypothetical protein IIA92_05385 [Chloroflexi bacterium]|nr:hypothetical protein [Chloroflexota bacterium]
MASNRNLRWEEIDKSKTDLSVLIQHFEVHNKTEGKSPRTVGWYNEVLGMFIKWLRSVFIPKTVGEKRGVFWPRFDRDQFSIAKPNPIENFPC